MPSTLYESVKKSVIEFAELRKKNEKVEDKMIFRWKLITLGLSILFIVLVGGFSQILKAVNNLPDVTQDRSFVLPLLKDVSDLAVPTVQQANNLVTGIGSSISATQDEYMFNRATLLFNYPGKDTLDINSVVQAINNKNRLVFVVSSTAVPAARFAFFGYQAYSESSNIADVVDSECTSSIMQLKSIRPSSTSKQARLCSTTQAAASIAEQPPASSSSSLSPSTVI